MQKPAGFWRVLAEKSRAGRGSRRGCEAGFTLVELLVVIAIIGVLVALLLPAIQAAREAGRRTQCSNQMRQMCLAMQNHVDSIGTFPSGGIDPWPRIEDYASGGRPFTAPKQGLSWAFQILPYLEQNAVHNLVHSDQLPRTKVDMYFCPSRRGPTQNPNPAAGVSGRWLMDYAALVGAPSRSEVNGPNGPLFWGARVTTAQQFNDYLADGLLCNPGLMWGGGATHLESFKGTYNPSDTFPRIFPTQGVIVRSSYFVQNDTGASGNPQVHDLGLPKPTGFRQITDGSSNTIVLCEKRIAVDRFAGDSTDDDAGWSDGWDYDTLRLSTCQPASDSTVVNNNGGRLMAPGASHASIFYCALADGSVRGINYDIDLETFNLMANKSDGEVIDAKF
jgi:prepilin-type N-terminal cleavage/methylation domain-containing protein